MTITIKWLPLWPNKPWKFSEKYNGLFSGKFEKCQFLAQNDYIWTQYSGKRFFGEWGLLSNDHQYDHVKPYKHSEKSNSWFSRKFERCQFRTQNDHIWAQYPWTRYFGEWELLSNDYHYDPLKPCKFSEKSNGRFLRKFGKCQFRAQNDYIWAQYPETRIFPKNSALSLFYLYGLLTSCNVSEKTNQRLWRKVHQGRTSVRTDDGQTDRQTEGQGWIYRTTPVSLGSKNNKDY